MKDIGSGSENSKPITKHKFYEQFHVVQKIPHKLQFERNIEKLPPTILPVFTSELRANNFFSQNITDLTSKEINSIWRVKT